MYSSAVTLSFSTNVNTDSGAVETSMFMSIKPGLPFSVALPLQKTSYFSYASATADLVVLFGCRQ